MTDLRREIRRRLNEAGWRFHLYAKGDYEIWINRATNVKATVDGKVETKPLPTEILKDRQTGKEILTWPM